MTKVPGTMNVFLLLGYIACIPIANWMIGHIGHCIPNGPCLIPVGFGLDAPSGVTIIGLALVLRDLVQFRMGRRAGLLAIVAGAGVSAFIAPPALVIASAIAFLFSELADFAVYTPLQKRGLIKAVIASSMVGLVVDSLLFLWLAFHTFDHIAGQIVGKSWGVLFAAIAISLIRRRLA